MKLSFILFLFFITGNPEWNTFGFICGLKTFEARPQDKAVYQEIQDVPFNIVEEVPIFPGCEDSLLNNGKKLCFSENVQQFFKDNYNTALSRELGLSGVVRIIGKFRVDNAGKIHSLGSRAPHPALSEELERVINLLPQMIPGKQRGKPVGVVYSLPFTFTI